VISTMVRGGHETAPLQSLVDMGYYFKTFYF
jgi:hypothetical protein